MPRQQDPPALLDLSDLETDARRILVLLADRLRRGQAQYGRLVLRSDRRSWLREALEEDLDSAIYRAAHILSRSGRSR